MSENRVLVVGTTQDYIAIINKRYAGRALFLTDVLIRQGSREPAPDADDEIVVDFSRTEDVLSALKNHLEKWHQSLSGVVCYDCEWLILAAKLANHFGLPYSSEKSVRLSRDKFLTKKTWSELGIKCPKTELVESANQIIGLNNRLGWPIVLKPLSSSGSELTFLCENVYDLVFAYREILSGLEQRSESPLYCLDNVNGNEPNFEKYLLAEEYIKGREYSADFIIEDDKLIIIRIARKFGGKNLPFGTTLAYMVPGRLPGWMNTDILKNKFYNAAKALGLNRAICMADFIIDKREIIFLELTPRIGGDCLPSVINRCCGVDTIGLALDFSEGKNIEIPSAPAWKEHIGIRLFAPGEGTLININCQMLKENSLIKEILIKQTPGHEITFPPNDYDSWILGHVIFEVLPDISLTRQCDEILDKVSIRVEQYNDKAFSETTDQNCRFAQS